MPTFGGTTRIKGCRNGEWRKENGE